MEGNGVEMVNNFPGSLIGNVTFAQGQVGQAASFDGNFTYIDAGTHPELSMFGGTQISFSAWLYRLPDPQSETGPVPGNDLFAPVINARTYCGEGNWQFYGDVDVYGGVYMSNWYQSVESSAIATGRLPFGTWSHVVITYDNGTYRFYVDGAFDREDTNPNSGPFNAALQSVQVGSDSCDSYWTGMIDELAVFDIALTAQQAADLYQSGLGGEPLCTTDSDGDGVPNNLDVCPGSTGPALVDGCDCAQILTFMPGNGGQCNDGALNVFSRRIGWASGVPRPPV
jgi:hypothetical protein